MDPQENFKFNLEKFLGRIKPDYSIVYIDNPNNSTGQFIDLSDIETVIKKAAKNSIIVLIDEDFDLRGNFLSKGILTTSRNDFVNMRKNFVRINTPPAADNILARLES